MNSKKAIAIVLILAAILAGAIITVKLTEKKPQEGPRFSKDILLITYTVKSFVGNIEKMDADGVWIASQITLNPQDVDIPELSTKSVIPTPYVKKVLFKAKITKNTKIIQNYYPIPYHFNKPATASAQKSLDISTLKKGQYVTATSLHDLRLAYDNSFEASEIISQATTNYLSGVIENTGNKEMVITAPYLDEELSRQKNAAQILTRRFTVRITDDTEISRMNPRTNTPERIPFGSLAKGMPVNVYANVDFARTASFDALMIDPVLEIIITPSPQPTLTPTR